MNLSDLHALLKENHRRLVVATRSPTGLPHIAAELAVHWHADHLYFLKVPNSLSEQNLRAVPEIAISVIDWAQRRGYQIKGIASVEDAASLAEPAARTQWLQMQARGCTSLIKVKIHEVYDIAPKSLIPKPLWDSASAWIVTPPSLPFQTPTLENKTLPAQVLQSVEKLHHANLAAGIPSFVATIDDRGIPNVSPRFFLDCNAQYWLYGDAFRNKTYRNAGRPSPLVVGMFDWHNLTGYVARGWVKNHFTGELLVQVRQKWTEMGFRNEALQAVTFHPGDLFQVQVGPRQLAAQNYELAQWFGRS